MLGTQWVHQHEAIVVRVIVGLAIGCLACLGFWLLTSDPPKKPQAASMSQEKGNQVGRDNSGKMFVADVLHYHEVPLQAAIPLSQPQSKIPRISFLRARKAWLKEAGQKWQKGVPGNRLGFVVEVENALATAGEPDSPPTRGIAAQLIVSMPSGLSERADRAFWLDEYKSSIDLDAGDSKAIVIGFFKDDTWSFCSNDRRVPPQFSRVWRIQKRVLESLSRPIENWKTLPLTLQSNLTVKLIIFQASTGTEIATRKYELTKLASAEQFSFMEIT
jgi:hypothetical protein